MYTKPITIELGNPPRAYAIKWTKRAEALNASLPRPQTFAGLLRPKHWLGALTTIIWCALVDRNHGFEDPADIAEYLVTPEQQTAAIKAVTEMTREAFPEKKTTMQESSSESGRQPSLQVASVPANSTGGG